MTTFTDVLKEALPWIGTALGGPLGGIAAKFVGDKLGIADTTTSKIISALQGMTPEQIADLKKYEQEFELKMAELGYKHIAELAALETRNVEAVNTTMQTEAKSEHWQTYSWRPAVGFAVAFNVAMSSVIVLITYVAVIFGSSYGAVALSNMPAIIGTLAAITGTAMPILGIASYHRGKMQVAATNNQTS